MSVFVIDVDTPDTTPVMRNWTFIMLSREIVRSRDLSAAAKLAYAVLMLDTNNCEGERVSRMPMAELEDSLGMSTYQVRRALGELSEHGYIEEVNRRNGKGGEIRIARALEITRSHRKTSGQGGNSDPTTEGNYSGTTVENLSGPLKETTVDHCSKLQGTTEGNCSGPLEKTEGDHCSKLDGFAYASNRNAWNLEELEEDNTNTQEACSTKLGLVTPEDDEPFIPPSVPSGNPVKTLDPVHQPFLDEMYKLALDKTAYKAYADMAKDVVEDSLLSGEKNYLIRAALKKTLEVVGSKSGFEWRFPKYYATTLTGIASDPKQAERARTSTTTGSRAGELPEFKRPDWMSGGTLPPPRPNRLPSPGGSVKHG